MILVVGEALIDLIGDSENAGKYTSVVGGANANVALALARRGTAQKFAGRISSDGFGAQIRHRLASNGVDLSWSINAAEQTTLAVATIDSAGIANYSFYVNGTADWGWTRSELPDAEKLIEAGVLGVQSPAAKSSTQPPLKGLYASGAASASACWNRVLETRFTRSSVRASE